MIEDYEIVIIFIGLLYIFGINEYYLCMQNCSKRMRSFSGSLIGQLFLLCITRKLCSFCKKLLFWCCSSDAFIDAHMGAIFAKPFLIVTRHNYSFFDWSIFTLYILGE